MQIVIDIDEEVLKTRKYTDYFGCGSVKLTSALDNAIPLPKGHGRLIDADRLFMESKALDVNGYFDMFEIIMFSNSSNFSETLKNFFYVAYGNSCNVCIHCLR